MDISPEQRKEVEEKLKNMSPEELQALQKKQCIFCQILDGKIPSRKLYEDDICQVILDIHPAAKGHCLVIPKTHYAIMPQIKEEHLQHLFIVAKEFSKIILKSLKADGTTIFVANGLVAGQRAQHFMVHVIPRKENDKILVLDQHVFEEELRKGIQKKIQKHFDKQVGVEQDYSEQQELEEHIRGEVILQENQKEEKDKLPDKVTIKGKTIKVLKEQEDPIKKEEAKELEAFDGEHVEVLKKPKGTKKKVTKKKSVKKKTPKKKVEKKKNPSKKAAKKKTSNSRPNKKEVDIGDLL